MFMHPVTIYIYIYIRGGTVHKCHSSVRTSVRGSRFNTILVQHSVQFIYFEQTVVQIKKEFHLDLKILHIRAVKMAEKLNLNFVPKYYQNSNYIRI